MPKKKKQGFSFNIFKKIGNYIRSKDSYGQTLNLNFDGEEAYKTIPGGMVTLLFLLLVGSYAFVKAKAMYNVEEWTLITQNVLQTESELK